ncbi:MAG: ABC transporter ATP-binding protein [Thermodesulfobacteriota bacterium]
MFKIEGLHSGYGHINVIHDLSLEVGAGETVAVIGANGAGKTTLLRTISGLVKTRKGRVIFQGRRLTGLPAEKIVRAGISHVPEGRCVFSRATVLTNLEMGAFLRKDRAEVKKDIDRRLHQFPILGERRNQPAGTLSGGEQQMLAIARGLMARPRLLLLDEPSMGLAPFLVNEIMRIIRRLSREGISLLLVEQNVHKALKITQRAYIMELGQIRHQGRSEDLLESDVIRKSYLGQK